MFERFTERARQVVVLAQDEARALGHDYIGTEHLLLGLLREEEGLAARVLEQFEVTVEELRAQVARLVGARDRVPTGQVPFTARAKTVLELSLREALALDHDHIGTEHILLGLARERDNTAMHILRDFDLDSETIQTAVVRALSPTGRPAARAPRKPPGDIRDEVESLRRGREEAIEAGDFERAAVLRDRERLLLSRASEHEDQILIDLAPAAAGPARDPLRLPLVLAIVAAAVAFPLGLLFGWLIWG